MIIYIVFRARRVETETAAGRRLPGSVVVNARPANESRITSPSVGRREHNLGRTRGVGRLIRINVAGDATWMKTTESAVFDANGFASFEFIS